MNSKWIGWVAAGAGLAAVLGGLYWYLKRRDAKKSSGGESAIEPSNPPRVPTTDPKRVPSNYVKREALGDALTDELDAMFEDGWPPDEETVEQLENGDAIVFAVESTPDGEFENTVQELISARVIVVEKTVVRARVMTPVRHTTNLGKTAGHGLSPGMAVDVPREYVLVAARHADREGYNSVGAPASTFKPSTETKKTYTVYPGTVYDLRLPYRTNELEWHIDAADAELKHIGEDGLLEQVMFSEGTPRGEFSVRALDNDPQAGMVLVGRWDFKLVD
ncbi:hypothetical protein G6O69_20995 [Pseudenhygromyxa sp. WMMC2535]|uniref:hypothetical protein n=1 Tax=Pseudenhygromyxa sp. WMMC2535 TaxID=2712867 RepID=UPI001557D2C3|nr:hypothetical protein [Pseudenhygromyxa sp. WMMC2535]NVB40331.1 hypothetical protein [Pseudenhygromyxa sp. WMMC2535]